MQKGQLAKRSCSLFFFLPSNKTSITTRQGYQQHLPLDKPEATLFTNTLHMGEFQAIPSRAPKAADRKEPRGWKPEGRRGGGSRDQLGISLVW